MSRADIQDMVIAHIRRNAHLPPDLEIDPSRSLLDLGVSSMDAMEIIHGLARENHIRLSPVRVAKIRTMNELIDLVAEAKGIS